MKRPAAAWQQTSSACSESIKFTNTDIGSEVDSKLHITKLVQHIGVDAFKQSV